MERAAAHGRESRGDDPSPSAIAETAWHALAGDEALERLGTSRSGLDEAAVRQRRGRFGENRLPEERRPGVARVFLRQFRDPLIAILLVAGAVSLGLASYANAVFIFAVLLVNAGIGAFQEYRAESSAQALKSALKLRVPVCRGGREQRVDAAELVPGDIVLLASGDVVSADIRLLEADNLRTDESMLTGESVPVVKSADAQLDAATELGDRATIVHAGSAVVDGTGAGVVCRTGELSEVGRIAQSLASREQQAPPLAIKLRRFTRQVAIVILGAIAVLAGIRWWQGTDPATIFQLAVALAVAAIPAGLPIAITVTMSIASNRMAKRNVIVRALAAVEGLGSCTLAASDKTGTLTANVLTIRRLGLADGTELGVSGEAYEREGRVTSGDGEALDGYLEGAVRRLAAAGALCNAAALEGEGGEPEGDSVDVAFLVLAAKLGMSREALLEESPEVGAIPFESSRKYAASFNESGGGVVAHVKGAAEVVATLSANVDADDVRKREEAYASQGYRVLAVASGEVAGRGEHGEDDLANLEFLGLVALIDPARPEVPDAVRRCRSAGVDVRMITGDHPSTGLAIARDLGIASPDDEAVTGKALNAIQDDGEYVERVRKAKVFARVEPTVKTRIVEALQRGGAFVAVTGDGVNDAPALKAAHVGVAMGRGGTDVARNAASLILTDDNFASIVDGIEEGRGAYDNVRKATWLLLATGFAEVLLFFLAVLTGLPLPLNAVQLLWLNLVTNGIQDVALAFEKIEPDVLERKPRAPDQPVFDRQMIKQVVASGSYIGLVAFAVYALLLETGLAEAEARNLLLLLMVLFENVHALSCRSETRSVFRIPLSANVVLLGAIVLAHAVHIGAMFVPGLSGVLGISPVAFRDWLMLLPVALSLLAFDEIAKLVHRRKKIGV